MKQFNLFKSLLFVAGLSVTGAVNAQLSQTSHPLAYTTVVGTTTLNNFYKDYVGTRLQVTAPTSIAGDYSYTTSNDGSGSTAAWGGMVTVPLVDVPIWMGSGAVGADSFGCAAFDTSASGAAHSLIGKIAVIWRGPISGACEFGAKALNAQNAGAIAVVLINEYPGEGPVGMAAGASGATVTIPVFMVGNLDGQKIAGRYRALPAGSVKMTITPWGKGLNNDLGFVPGGVSIWHDCAIPAYQLAGSPTAVAYKGIDGAFIANYGLHNATNVKLSTDVSFTPASGSAASIHTTTLTVTPSAGSTTFAPIDSIYTVFSPEYNLSGISGKGRVDMTYNITSDSTDLFNYDNTYTHSFYTTDSIFSKGRYDFTNNHPVANLWSGPTGSYLWGVPYFVAHGGAAFKDVQFSVSTGPGVITASLMTFYMFKWVDGSFGTGSLDNAIEGGELELVGAAQYTFNGTTDSSFNFFTTPVVSMDTVSFSPTAGEVQLTDNTMYFVTAEFDASTSTATSLALGCDGIATAYPRSYGRSHFSNITELYNPIAGGVKADMRTTPDAAFLSYTFGGGSFDADSIVYNSQYGLIPSIAVRVMPYTPPNAVTTVAANTNKVELFPNPATENVNISIDLTSQAKQVTYTIINSLGQVFGKETKSDVTKDVTSFSTSKMPSGNYFMIINADGKQMYKKFTVIK